MKILICDLIGQKAVSWQDGEKIYDLIFPLLSSGEEVELDFAGVVWFTPVFFNAAIGRLLAYLLADDFDRLLSFTNIHMPLYESVLGRVIEHAKHYYSLDEATRKAYDAILTRDIEEL
jgi:STAS-like domain of unknown function (DUF4325)